MWCISNNWLVCARIRIFIISVCIFFWYPCSAHRFFPIEMNWGSSSHSVETLEMWLDGYGSFISNIYSVCVFWKRPKIEVRSQLATSPSSFRYFPLIFCWILFLYESQNLWTKMSYTKQYMYISAKYPQLIRWKGKTPGIWL